MPLELLCVTMKGRHPVSCCHRTLQVLLLVPLNSFLVRASQRSEVIPFLLKGCLHSHHYLCVRPPKQGLLVPPQCWKTPKITHTVCLQSLSACIGCLILLLSLFFFAHTPQLISHKLHAHKLNAWLIQLHGNRSKNDSLV